jgi:hypothetical protein
MISRRICGGALAVMLTICFTLPVSAQSLAQMPRQPSESSPWPVGQAEQSASEADSAEADEVEMTGIDVDKLDWSQLDVDASTLISGPGAKSTGRPLAVAASAGDITWSGNSRPDGGSAVSVKQSVSPFWDARVGADMTVTPEPTTMAELVAEKAANGGAVPQSSGTAWAAITAPGAGSIWDKTAVEARIDPGQDQSKLGTSVSKSVPISEQYSLTLQDGYSMVQQGIVPVPGMIAHPARNYETEQSAKLNADETSTSFTAGQTLSSNDGKWLRKFGAEQKLSDGVSLSGSVGETAQGAISESIAAKLKRSW